MDHIGIIGGSGLYDFLNGSKKLNVTTKYGDPSSHIEVTNLGRTKVFFIARHGINHQYPPHIVNYRANIEALYSLGVRHILATHAVGSLNPNMMPGEFVISDQFTNQTWGRKDTFYDGPETVHVGVSEPFCNNLREKLIYSLEVLKAPFHKQATMLVIQGPRYNTKAENRKYLNEGNDLISMTAYPEVVLAREKKICYASIGLITDSACVLGSNQHPQIPATHCQVVDTFQQSQGLVQELIHSVIFNYKYNGDECNCHC